jgi:3-oxoacyl-[acyl-carrier-protein] synthase-3
MPRTIKEVLAKNNLLKGDIDLFVFHQANHFMLEKIRKSNAINQEKFYVNMSDIGNTVSASIPIALKRAEMDGVLKNGMKVMVVGFGVGLSWGATILTWTS